MVSSEPITQKRGRGRFGKPSNCPVCGFECRTRRLADDHCKGVIRCHVLRCEWCAAEFKAQQRNARFCSYRCASLALINQRRSCVLCGKNFQASTRTQACCSGECANKTVVAKAKAKATAATCKQCRLVFQPKRGRYNTFCSRKCYFDYINANIGTEANKKNRPRCANTNRPTAQGNRQSFKGWERRARRRARENGVYIESVSVADILARDGSKCHICGLELDLVASVPNAKAATLDHLIPQRTWHGAHVMENVKLAHFACNSIRSDRKITPQLIEQCRSRITGSDMVRKSAKKSASTQRRLF